MKEVKQANTIEKQHAWVVWLQGEQSSRREAFKTDYISHDPPLPPFMECMLPLGSSDEFARVRVGGIRGGVSVAALQNKQYKSTTFTVKLQS